MAAACSSSAGRERPAPVTSPHRSAPPDAGPPAAPDPDAERAAQARTVADPKAIQSYATVPRDQLSRMPPHAKGQITARTAAPPADGRVRWGFTVTDTAGREHRFAVELPDGIALPAALGAAVEVHAGHHGGGPNVIGTLAITDAGGGLLLAINRLPEGWSAEAGRRLSTVRGEPYDEHAHAVVVRATAGRPVELVADWRAVTLDGVRFYGNGSAARRSLKRKRVAPLDYVGGWVDYTLVRVAPAAR